MPRSKDPSHYPNQYLKIAQACAIHGETVVLEFPSWREALKMQNSFIAWVASMRRVEEKLTIARASPETQYEKMWIDALAMARRTQPWVEKRPDGTARLTFQNRDETDIAKKLDAALAAAKGGESPTVAAEANEFFSRIAAEVAAEKSPGLLKPLSELDPAVRDRLAGYGNRRALKDDRDNDDKG